MTSWPMIYSRRWFIQAKSYAAKWLVSCVDKYPPTLGKCTVFDIFPYGS